MLTGLLILILMALVLVNLELRAIKGMIFEARLCAECHGTGRIPRSAILAARNAELAKAHGRKGDNGSEGECAMETKLTKHQAKVLKRIEIGAQRLGLDRNFAAQSHGLVPFSVRE